MAISPSYELWVTVQAHALAAEKDILDRILASADGKGPPVPPQQIAAAQALRQKASELLSRCLDELGPAARPGPLAYLSAGQEPEAPGTGLPHGADGADARFPGTGGRHA